MLVETVNWDIEMYLQVEDYPTLLFYPANDKSNPVNIWYHHNFYFLDFSSLLALIFVKSHMQIKLPTKSTLKDLAALINKNLKTQDSVSKDEL